MLSFVSGIALMLAQAAPPSIEAKPQTEAPAPNPVPTPASEQSDQTPPPPAYSETEIDAEARRLSVLCQRGIEAERVMAGGSEIVWNQWVRETQPTREQQAIQFQFCERYFAAYDRANRSRR